MPIVMPNLENLPRTLELTGSGAGACLRYIDQRLLPERLVVAETDAWTEVVNAIKTLAVRGAPAIGVAGVAALALWAANDGSGSFRGVCETVTHARPTAVNLAWGVERACAAVGALEGRKRADVLFDLVKRMEEEDEKTNRAIGAQGAELLEPGARILTHCNAGSLATVFFGTALGIVYAAAAQGKIERVYADETRPAGQGARLTVWELAHAGIPVTLICDNMAAGLMAQGNVDAVIVGADRIAANGDVANKIGTYGVAVLAREHGIPFYVAAPESTIDMHIETGAGIPIEQRAADEVLVRPIEGVDVWNPAFDVTPAHLVTRIITEKGIFEPRELAQRL